MALETTASTVTNNIQSIQRPNASNSSENVSRVGDRGASPFSPRTDVNIRNSISDMAAILSRLSEQQNSQNAALPQQLQKIVQNVLQTSFSMDTTLSAGMGSTMESQRFSMEQLMSLSRMLTQLGNLENKGQLGQLSDNLQALLQNFKEFLSAQDSTVEPVLLHKAAFQLLNEKSTSDLSPALQNVLTTANTSGGIIQSSPAGQTEGFQFLKQLMQYLMPSESSGNVSMSTADTKSVLQGENMPAMQNNAADGNGNQMPAVKNGNLSTQNTGTVSKNAADAGLQTNTKANVLPGDTVNSAQVQEAVTEKGAGQTSSQIPTTGFSRTEEKDLQPAQIFKQTFNPSQNKNAAAINTVLGNYAEVSRAANGIISSMESSGTSFQNTEQTLNSLKDLAGLLLKDSTLTEKDTLLLQNFVNGKQEVLGETDARQLQLLLRLSQSNVPAVIQQAAAQQNLENLPKLWAFMQLCDLASLKDMKSREYKNASKSISDFVSTMKHSWQDEGVSNTADGQRSLNFMMPLYLANGEVKYPAYIHVYDQEAQANEKGEVQPKETWLRVCVLTDNIGAAELVCCVQDKQNLSMRVFFSDDSVVHSFGEYVPEIKEALKNSSLILTDFKYGVIGKKL